MTQHRVFRSAGLQRCAFACAALGLVLGLAAAPAGAASVTIQMTARVAESCTAALAANAVVEGSQAQGVVTTRCNTRFDLFLVYPTELGPVVVNYDGRQAASSTGVVELTRNAAPMMVSAPFVLQTSAAPEVVAAAPLTVQIAPRGL